MNETTDIRATLARLPDPIALLESLFALAPVGFQIYEASGRSVLVNQAFRDLFGSEPPPDYNVLRDEIAERNGISGLIQRAFRGETIALPPTWYDPRELKQVRVEKGNRVAISATFFPLSARSGAVTHVGVVFHDLTAEILAREIAERDRERMSAVIDQTAEGVVVCDEQGTATIVNRAARAMGLPGEPIPRERWAEAFRLRHADGTPIAEEEIPLWRALQGESNEALVWVEARDGLRAVEGTAVPIRRPDGSIRGAVVTFRDVTERRRREEETERTATFRERFIGVLGHDLRSPLAAISANAGLILRFGELPPTVTAAATRIASTALRMGRMISDLLDFTQARLGGGLIVSRKPCDLAEIAQNAIDEALAADPGRTARLCTKGETSGEFDPDRVVQLLSNLLHNALSYSKPDSGVDVEVLGGPSTVEVAVRNYGARIPAAELASLFDPFRRGSSAGRGGDSRGLGLGLYIVEQIALAHGGNVSVESDERATVFRARLQR